MKKILLAGLLLTAVQSYAQSTFETLAIGSTIPMGDVNMKSTEGKQVSLNNAKTDNGLIVMFSCNTCPYVIKSQLRTKEVMEYAKAHEIGMVIINSNEAQRGEADSYEAMVKYAKKQGYTVPYVVDEKSKLADAFGASHTPEVFLFDANGKLIYKGAMEDNPGSPADSKEMYLKKAMDNMLAELPVDPNTTKSIGCSIKRS
ncbi:MAG: thioredoxin family protein [Bacteroidetes bacterium]|nr:thioredoxin family protein [Bacteroidota bacterium]